MVVTDVPVAVAGWALASRFTGISPATQRHQESSVVIISRTLTAGFAAAAVSLAAAPAHYWGFETDRLPANGAFRVTGEGSLPEYAGVVAGSRIWDGGSYSVTTDGNRRSVYFGETNADGLSPAGGEVFFPGTSGAFRFPAFTVECFVRVASSGARYALLVSKRRSNGSSWSLATTPQGEVMARLDTQPGTSGPGFNRTVHSGTAIDDGEWHHLAMTFDPERRECRLYIDHAPCGSGTTTGPLVYDDGELCIGRGLNGWIDEVRISDRVLHPEHFLRTEKFFTDLASRQSTRPGVMLDLTRTRVQTSVALDWERLGTLRPKSVDEIPGDFWSLGCETLDRDLADWDAYKGYIRPLGITRIRLQGGWARTERQKGVYDFDWLDHIVDSAHELGLTVCLETSYGNRLYEARAALGPGGALPSSEEALEAWDHWVEAMVRHYAPKGVHEWMMYNEPNLNRKNTLANVVAFNCRTADTIKRVDPDARIAGLVVSGLNLSWIRDWLEGVRAKGRLGHFDWVIYHGYGANPDSLSPGMKKAKATLMEIAPGLKLWQGEAGCASEEVQYALSGIDWTELSHAKWNARRMVSDFAHGIESTVFTISDLSYHKTFISRYGLLKTAADNSIIKVKTAYYVVNNVVSLFNSSLSVNRDAVPTITPGNGVSAYTFRHRASGCDLIALWDGSSIPRHRCDLSTVDLSMRGLTIHDPVWLDLLTSRIYRVPSDHIETSGDATTFVDMPIFDSPIVLTDRSVLSYVTARQTGTRPRNASAAQRAADRPVCPLRGYRLFGTQKPVPAVILDGREPRAASWSANLAGMLREEGVHAFILADPDRRLSEAVAYVRSQAAEWQVDATQIGVLGGGVEVVNYRDAGADFAVMLTEATEQAGAGDGPEVLTIRASAMDEQTSTVKEAAWFRQLSSWLLKRKKDVF